MHGESRSINMETVKAWKHNLSEIIKFYQPNEIFNADETAIFWKQYTKFTISPRGEKTHGFSVPKDRLSLLLCVNMIGETKKILIVGKSMRPRCFKEINNNTDNLGIIYKSNKNAWMTKSLFNEWLIDWDNELKMSSKKVLLL